jgi:hypothetical protein
MHGSYCNKKETKIQGQVGKSRVKITQKVEKD